MSGYGYSEEHQPVTYWRGHPIYAAYLVVIVYGVLAIVAAVAGMGAFDWIVTWLGFGSAKIFSGEVWRLFSYGLFNLPDIQFAFDLLMLWWFGRELERIFGRKKFAQLYGGIYLAPTVVLTLIGTVWPRQFFGQPGALALFVGFATHFPGMPVFFTLLAQWAAVILVSVFSLMAIAARDWSSLIVLWAGCGYAHLFVRHQQGRFTLPDLRFWKRPPRLRVIPDLPAKKSPAPAKPSPADTTIAEVDALLDKIAQSGIGSLSVKERAKLEAARDDLKKRGAGRTS